MALRRRRSTSELKDWPPIAVVVPVFNEEGLILAKLEDLKLCDYPADRRTIFVLDGGSRDQAAVLVEREISLALCARVFARLCNSTPRRSFDSRFARKRKSFLVEGSLGFSPIFDPDPSIFANFE
jgi:glycosyltransferase involved in cell wall biosynthesis